ncbi:MAG: hypothetical protein ACK4WM_08165 [Thermoflexales bacterium]
MTSTRTPRSPRAAREVQGRGLEILINQRRHTADITPPVCPTCGKPMRLKGRRAKPVNGLEGQSRIERSYSVCPNGCGQTVSPLDRVLRLSAARWREGAAGAGSAVV